MTQRIQKEIAPGWEPDSNVIRCIEHLKDDLEKCDMSGFIAHTGCVFGNAEAAFYEKLISEDEMNSFKEMAAHLRHLFTEKCKCSKK